ncbi:hypothetical protein L6452_31103 [Arctium lappa]|uniref:Uncharacterized protein n=1 Tax=Arctium lappa TaxID=4217 RepID=A0ACB8ZJ52_ARCLA|nr:hypothetical protein L6452_31103 [Arctium lappa]
MGELDENPFHGDPKKRRCSVKGGTDNAIKLASLWEECLRDPNWYPFKINTDIHGVTKNQSEAEAEDDSDDGDNDEEILDEEDYLIASLKEESDDIYNVVITALKEINEYNPSGSSIVHEEAILAIGALAYATGPEFGKYCLAIAN